MRFLFALASLFLASNFLIAQQVNQVIPPFWFSGFQNDELHLLLTGSDLSEIDAEVDYPGVSILKFDELATNPAYAILVLRLEKSVQPGKLKIIIQGKKKAKFSYEIKRKNRYEPKGLNASDFLVDFSKQQDTLTVKQIEKATQVGSTAIVFPEVLTTTNTSFFKAHETYETLIGQAKTSGCKVVQAVSFNSLTHQASLSKNPPQVDWFHKKGPGHSDTLSYLKSNNATSTLYDPHKSYVDLDRFSNGSKADSLLDFNQENDYVEQFLIQHSMWLVAAYNLDAIQVKEYGNTDQIFMRIWRDRLKEEFPSLFVYADIETNSIASQAWFIGKTALNKEFDNHLESIIDYQLMHAFLSLSETGSIHSIYRVVSNDFIYPDANDLVTQMPYTYFDKVNGSRLALEQFKLSLAMLATLRGIPSINGSVFKASKEYASFLNSLVEWRNANAELFHGRLLQFYPENGVYVYFRDTESKAIMVVANANNTSIQLDNARFNEVLHEYPIALDVVSKLTYSTLDNWELNPTEIRILELKKK